MASPMSAPGAWSESELSRFRRMTLIWAVTVLILFPVLAALGYYMRMFQSNFFPATRPEWFYSVLTLHALGMVGTWYVGAMAGASYLLSRYVRLSLAISKFAFGGTLLGVVLLIVCTLGGFFGVGWYFLFPLPLHSNGVWPPWATGMFLSALAILGVTWTIWTLNILHAIAQRYSLGTALGWHYLRGKAEPMVAPIVIICTVSLVVALAGFVAAVIVLLLFIAQWLGWLAVDALLMKNLTFLFGHNLVNITLYLGVGMVYELLPAYTGRPWRTNRVVVGAWSAILLLILFAYFHHLYMDFAQPRWIQAVGQIASYSLSVPAAVVSIFGALTLVYASRMRWTLASMLFVLGIMGWAVGGVAAVIDSTVAVNLVFHNTWIRRIPASPEAAKRRVDRRWVRIVEFREFLTLG
ncbi:MAG: cbb3-type cytochrome c oxidase subunit I, partial [Acidobacteria bacterium]|nr:cbb3-type cytochrome c oxidase subunit I [Acidobacteriota bacterium]